MLKPALAVLVLAAGCSGSASSPATATPDAAGGAGLLLAVAPAGGGLDLYRAGADHRAEKVGSLQPPAYRPYAQVISLSAAAQPDVCVLWGEREEEAEQPLVSCYQPRPTGSPRTWGGVPVKGLPEDVTGIALSPDGTALAWLDPDPAVGREARVVVATAALRPAAGALRPDRRILPEGTAGRAFTDSQYLRAEEVVWAGSTGVVVTACCSADRPEDLVVPLSDQSVREGWLSGANDVGYVEQDPVWEDEYVVSATDQTALLRQSNPFAANGAPAGRVLVVDRRKGVLLQVVATSPAGRVISRATGGTRGVVFVTEVDQRSDTETGSAKPAQPDPRTYLRLPGESSAKELTGLPKDAFVVAQP